MRKLAILACCIAGCVATKEQWEEYDRDVSAWHQDDRTSNESWSRATGGSIRGGGSPLSKPKEPGLSIGGIRFTRSE